MSRFWTVRGPRLRRAVAAALAAAVLVCVIAAYSIAGGTSGPPPAHAHGRHRARPAPPASAQVTIGAHGSAQPVPPSFLGISTEYSSLPEWSGQMPLLERVLSLIHSDGGGPLVLRIGGDSADHSFWDPHETPMPSWAFTIHPQWLEQASDLVSALGARLILDLNLITDTPAEAAQWARAAEAALPRRSITAFEIGNEPDIYDRAYWLAITGGGSLIERALPAALSAGDYVRSFRAYARALAQVAPDTRLAGPALARPTAHAAWIPALLSGARQWIGLVTAHRYPYSACASPGTKAFPTIGRVLSPQASSGLARELAPLADEAHDAGLPFRLTELNSVTCGGRPGVSDSFATALWAPDALFALLRAGVDGVNVHVRANTINAPFAITAGGLEARPLLYGLILFAHALGPDARLVTPAVHTPPSLNFSAYGVRVGRDTLHVVLVDKSRRAVHVTLRLPATGTADVQRLLAPSPASTTGVTLGGRSLATNGAWQGSSAGQTLANRGDRYTIELRRFSAALVSVRVSPGALGVPPALRRSGA